MPPFLLLYYGVIPASPEATRTLWTDAPAGTATDQVAAVCKAGLGGNKVQVIIGKEEQVLDLVQTDKFDILLAALSVVF